MPESVRSTRTCRLETNIFVAAIKNPRSKNDALRLCEIVRDQVNKGGTGRP